MAKFITTTEISFFIEKLLKDAKNTLSLLHLTLKYLPDFNKLLNEKLPKDQFQ